MRLVVAALWAMIGLSLATPIRVERDLALGPRAGPVAPSVSKLDFNIDGTTAYFAGVNAYYLAFQTPAAIRQTLLHIRQTGGKVVRISGFNDVNSVPTDNRVWFHFLKAGTATQINTGVNGLQRLDYVVNVADQLGLKLVINFVNNWADYGGMPMYNEKFKTGRSPDLWYTDPNVQSTYQNYIQTIISRYHNYNSIFAWELANEPRCRHCPTSVITEWAKKTSAFVRKLDPKRMIALGDEGFGLSGGGTDYQYSKSEGIDFEANLRIPDISYGTFHNYPDNWGESNVWGSGWITNHASVCVRVGKPCVMEEYGSKVNKVQSMSPWQSLAVKTNGIAGDMIWLWGEDYNHGILDQYTVYYGQPDFKVLVADRLPAVNKAHPQSSGTGSAPPPPPPKPQGAGGLLIHSQCGGIGWKGPFTCAAGLTCQKQNNYYYQCL